MTSILAIQFLDLQISYGKNKLTSRKAIVIESYDYSITRVVVTARYCCNEEYVFMFLPYNPSIFLGDIIEVDYDITGKMCSIYLFRGNSKLRYRLQPDDFPPGILQHLIEDRLS